MTRSCGYFPYAWRNGRKIIVIGTPARKQTNKIIIPFLVQLFCSCHVVFSSFIIRTCQLFKSFSLQCGYKGWMSFVTTETRGCDNKNGACAKYATETDGAIIRYHLRHAGGGRGGGWCSLYCSAAYCTGLKTDWCNLQTLSSKSVCIFVFCFRMKQ